MPDTGLRYRFFFVILTSLILSAVAINIVHSVFFKSQRLKLIDRQIAESSQTLLQSYDFQRQHKLASAALDEVISKVLGGARIGKLFILRDVSGKILFQSFNFGLLNIDIPKAPEWVTVETEDQYVRVRNWPLPQNPSVTLQVGLVLDRNFLNWQIIDDRVIYYVISIVFLLFGLSALLTLFLLSPLRNLISHLNSATSNLTFQKMIDPLPLQLRQFKKGLWARSDEFASLLDSVQKLIGRINLNYRLTRFWTSQMAHGLKTPLAILRAETEAKQKSGTVSPEFAKDVYKEIAQMSGIIDQFLDWAELESALVQKDLHALRMKNVTQGVTARLEKLNPGRIRLQVLADYSVLANPVHLDQVITNLLTNALKYSPLEREVEVTLRPYALIVHDRGAGIPIEVQERIGEPFNTGIGDENLATGNGLGLAMVATVVKLYQWRLQIDSDPSGTHAAIHFRPLVPQSGA